MRIKVLLFALWLFLSGNLALGGGTVSTTIQLHPGLALPTSIIACHDSLDVTLDITGMVPAEQIVFQGVAGSVIDPAIIVTGNFMPTINSDSITIANTMAGDGSVRFTVKLTDCALYNNQPASIAFNTYYPDSITLNQSASIVLLEPTLEITDSGLSTLPTHNCEYLLLNDVIKRYYKIKAHNGPIDAFSLDIVPQLGIEITSVSAVGPDSAPVLKRQLFSGSAN